MQSNLKWRGHKLESLKRFNPQRAGFGIDTADIDLAFDLIFIDSAGSLPLRRFECNDWTLANRIDAFVKRRTFHGQVRSIELTGSFVDNKVTRRQLNRKRFFVLGGT